jgi:hypothetical protein
MDFPIAMGNQPGGVNAQATKKTRALVGLAS